MNVLDRFLKYVSFDTGSDESSPTVPVSYTHLDVYKRQKKGYEAQIQLFEAMAE